MIEVSLVDDLTYQEKVERSLGIIREAWKNHGSKMVVAHSLGKDSCVVWDLVQIATHGEAKGFIVTTRYKPADTKAFTKKACDMYPNLKVFKNDEPIPEGLYKTDPKKCCELLKVTPVRWAIDRLGATCWVTGLRCTEGHTRTDFDEIEELDKGLVKLNPILIWTEREVWQYLALKSIPVNPMYAQGYRSLGCAPCSEKGKSGDDERQGRWAGTEKCGGECGIHTMPLKEKI